jgi:hypothetical protein
MKNIHIIPFVIIAMLASVSHASMVPGNEIRPQLTQYSATELIVYPRQGEFVDSFERSDLAPWTTLLYNWGIRDTSNTYGPETPAFAGYQYAGLPAADIPVYLGDQTGHLVSPTIDLTGWSEFYLSFSYWSQFEGQTNFDGGIVEISADNGTNWAQVDENAEGHLNPTYDSRLAGTGALGDAWAYCYPTDPNWRIVSSQDLIALGYVSTGDQIQVRFTFASDPLAGGEGWFIDDVRMADTPPADLQPPAITHTPLPDTTDTLNSYTISATVVDIGSGVNYDSVYLHYQIESGSVINVKMDTIGTGSPDIYEAEIPAQTYHTDIFYYISAVDIAGNEKVTRVYNFEVTNARTIIYDDGQPWWGTGLVDIGDGSFVQFDFEDVGIDSGVLHQAKIFFDRAGDFDLRVYEATVTGPGVLIDSIAGLSSPGYEWSTIELDGLGIETNEEVVVGCVIQTESLGVLRDSTLTYPGNQWNYNNGVWAGGDGGDWMIRLKVIPITFTGIADRPEQLPERFVFSQVSSNPARDRITLQYELPATEHILLNVYDITGKRVAQLVNGIEEPGIHRISWDGRDARGNHVSSGVYFMKLKAGDYSSTQKILFVR